MPAPAWLASYRYDARPIVSAPDCRDCRHRSRFGSAEWCNRNDDYLDRLNWPGASCWDFEAPAEIEEAE